MENSIIKCKQINFKVLRYHLISFFFASAEYNLTCSSATSILSIIAHFSAFVVTFFKFVVGYLRVKQTDGVNTVMAKPNKTTEDNAFEMELGVGSQARRQANAGLSPVINNANTSRVFAAADGLDLLECISVYADKVKVVKDGDLSRMEAILTVQANTLDAIFNKLACRAAANMAEHLSATETYLKLALKAQAQCAKTIETLANIKNPSTVSFVKQANIGQSVQVNNGTPPAKNLTSTRTHGGKQKQANELLEHHHGERLDIGTTGEAIAVNTRMETVATVNRASE